MTVLLFVHFNFGETAPFLFASLPALPGDVPAAEGVWGLLEDFSGGGDDLADFGVRVGAAEEQGFELAGGGVDAP